jgi:hypothetical protein
VQQLQHVLDGRISSIDTPFPNEESNSLTHLPIPKQRKCPREHCILARNRRDGGQIQSITIITPPTEKLTETTVTPSLETGIDLTLAPATTARRQPEEELGQNEEPLQRSFNVER